MIVPPFPRFTPWLPALATAGFVCSAASSAFAKVTELGPGDDVETALNAQKPGDELVLRGGTYTLADAWHLTMKGTEAMPIVVRAKDGEKPKGEKKNADILQGHDWLVAAVTPGGVYRTLKDRWGKELAGHFFCDLLVLDEASRIADDLYRAVRPMLAVSDGKMVALTTPWGKRGFFYSEWTRGEGWERVKITAPECKRISEAFLEGERRALPESWYRQEYLCEFSENENGVFRYDQVQFWRPCAPKPMA